MADEQLPVEPTTPEITPDQDQSQVEPEQTLEVETPSIQEEPKAESDQGDLRIPLQEERRKRQEYEQQLARLNDPAFIFEQARRLGLADGDFTPEVPALAGQPIDVAAEVNFQLQIAQAKEKYPEVTNDPVLSEAAWALVQKGHSPLQAVDIVQKNLDKRLAKATEAKVKERIDAEASSEASKRSAALTETGSSGSSESSEIERLTAVSKNWKDPKAQENALLELMKLRAK